MHFSRAWRCQIGIACEASRSNAIEESTKIPYCPHLAIGVDNLDAAALQLKQNGVSLLRGPLEVEGKVRWLYFADPDQNVIELVEWL